ncbi:hypothetical protein [Reichenbachiella sp.]|uniref:hypothetical protein n=1 Tax=Reichenbachiella sp. TaxID=2184521 RepID=UPI003B5A8CD0
MEKSNQERVNNLDEALNYNMLLSSKEKIKQGRVILIAIALLNIVALFFASSSGFTLDVIITLIYVVVFIVLAILTTKMANKAIIIGLSIYLGTIVLVALVDWSTLFNGLLIKVLIVSGLVKAYLATKDVKELQQKLAEIEMRKKDL